MKAAPRIGIALRLALVVLFGTSLVFGFIVLYSYTYSRDIILAESERSARNLTLSTARRIEQEFRAVEKPPQDLAAFLRVDPTETQSRIFRLIEAVVTENPEIFGSTVAYEPYAFSRDARGFAPYFYTTPEGLGFAQLADEGYDYFRQDWYRLPTIMGKPIWSEPYYDEGGGDILMTTYSVPMYAAGEAGTSGKVKGVVTADISLDWLNRLVLSIRIGKRGYSYIISSTGRFVVHPRPEFRMTESIFSIAEERGLSHLRQVGRRMLRSESGFVDLGETVQGEDAYLAYARIPSPGWVFAAVFPKQELFAEVTALHGETVSLAAAGILALLFVSIVIALSISRPVTRIAAAAQQVAEGNFDVDLSDIKRSDEVGRLAEAFTRMTEGLKERDWIRATFGRYVTQEVVKRILESKDGLSLGGEQREITILMSDLRGFTALTSGMPPDRVITFLNRYLGRMVEIIIDHKGIIDEIIGDGILAFFGAPEPLEDHPARAVSCALHMQAAMDEINRLNEAEGYPYLEMGIAVNTGDVVVGNIGSEKRSKYGAVGMQVNFTGRMESFTVGHQVLISQSAYDRIAPITDVRCSLNVHMKGIPGTVVLYDVRALGEPYNVRLTEVDTAPRKLNREIPVFVTHIDQKIVSADAERAVITHVSPTSAIMRFTNPVEQWEDLRMQISDDSEASPHGEIFGKVVSVDPDEDGSVATVRFTSVSASAHRLFREAQKADEDRI